MNINKLLIQYKKDLAEVISTINEIENAELDNSKEIGQENIEYYDGKKEVLEKIINDLSEYLK